MTILPPQSENELRWKLLDNGIDFIRSGVEAYFDTNARPRPAGPFGVPPEDDGAWLDAEDGANAPARPDHAYKYAVLHLHAGCLLLFKERLRREHESLIFQKIDGNFEGARKRPKTVDFDQALERLTRWGRVTLAESDRKHLRTLQRLRNDFEHFEVQLERRHAEAVVTGIVEFTYRFLRDELDTKMEDEVNASSWRHVSQLRTIAERIKKEDAEDWQRRFEECRKMSKDELRELAAQGAYHPKHNPDARAPLWCGDCGRESLHAVAPDMLVCTTPKCGGVFEADACLRCGETVLAGTTYCDDCEGYIEHQMSKD